MTIEYFYGELKQVGTDDYFILIDNHNVVFRVDFHSNNLELEQPLIDNILGISRKILRDDTRFFLNNITSSLTGRKIPYTLQTVCDIDYDKLKGFELPISEQKLNGDVGTGGAIIV
jgi:hypothetical protein